MPSAPERLTERRLFAHQFEQDLSLQELSVLKQPYYTVNIHAQSAAPASRQRGSKSAKFCLILAFKALQFRYKANISKM